MGAARVCTGAGDIDYGAAEARQHRQVPRHPPRRPQALHLHGGPPPPPLTPHLSSHLTPPLPACSVLPPIACAGGGWAEEGGVSGGQVAPKGSVAAIISAYGPLSEE
eukprot:1450074-Rhodomonas_salina.1